MLIVGMGLSYVSWNDQNHELSWSKLDQVSPEKRREEEMVISRVSIAYHVWW